MAFMRSEKPVLTAPDEELREALQEGNIPILLTLLTLGTGDQKWFKEPYKPSRTRALDDNDAGGLSQERQAEVRAAAFELIRQWRDEKRPIPSPPTGQELIGLLSASLGEEIPPEYAAPLAEEAGFAPRPGITWTPEDAWGEDAPPETLKDMRIVIVGGGPAGIATAISLSRLGIPYCLIERNSDFGGVWRDNDYPGAGVDTATHIYSYSFAPRATWSRFYAKQPEIQSYFKQTADEFGVRDHSLFDTEAVAMIWDEEVHHWKVHTRNKAGDEQIICASAVISCVGVLNEPAIPSFSGMDRFQGAMFHSARWDHSLSLEGKRVAVIGAGATAMQVVPAIADDVAKVLVFQRSPQWVAPNPNYLREVPPRVHLLMEQVPYYRAFYRLRQIWQGQDKLLPTLRRDPAWPHPERSVNATNEKHRILFTKYIEEQLSDRPDLIEKVLPSYPPYGKRILMDNSWFQTLKRDEVELITDRITSFDETGIVMTDGTRYDVDIVVLATGFRSSEMLASMEVQGVGGVRLKDEWDTINPHAYLGVTVPHFPNFFMVGGPNTFLGHGGSAIYTAECAISYISQLLVQMVKHSISAVEVRQDVCDEYNSKLDAEQEHLIWSHPGTNVWFRNAVGRVTATLPWRGVDYWAMTREPDLNDFVVTPSREKLEQLQ